MNKIKFIYILLFCGIAFFVSGCDQVQNDPFSNKYDIEKFSFSDFKDHKELAKFLAIHFPIGTSRSKVEHLLIEVGGAKINDDSPWSEYKDTPGLGHGYDNKEVLKNFKSVHRVIYMAPSGNELQGWTVSAHYDENEKLLLLVSHIYLVHKINP